MLEMLMDPNVWASFAALSALEIILGIDNVIFLSIITERLAAAEAKRARQLGLLLALVFRVGLLLSITLILTLKNPVFTVYGQGFSIRDLILIAGGLFLIIKSTQEVHAEIAGGEKVTHTPSALKVTFGAVVAQIVVIDAIFSIDSIITAVAMVPEDQVAIMIAAVAVSIAVMYFAVGPVSAFIEKHPTTKMLALSFLLLIGVALVADGFGTHVPRGYIYFAMAFAALTEMFNIMAFRRRMARKTRHRGES